MEDKRKLYIDKEIEVELLCIVVLDMELAEQDKAEEQNRLADKYRLVEPYIVVEYMVEEVEYKLVGKVFGTFVEDMDTF